MPTVPTHFVSAPCSLVRHWGVRAFGPARILFIFQQKTCCEQLTNCHGTVPSTPATDVSAGWWLMKISWKTSMGLSSGGPPWFIMPAFMPEATGSTLSASTDPCKFKGVGMRWAEGLLIYEISLLLTHFLFSHSKLAAHSCYCFFCFFSPTSFCI